jgi:hypothetical protein
VFLARAVELCSLRGVPQTVLAVDEAGVRDASDDLDEVTAGLGLGSYVLPPGGLALLAEQRRARSEFVDAERALREQVDRLGVEHDRVQQQRQQLAAELTSIYASRAWKFSRLLGRGYQSARRLIERTLRR